uniref:Vascular endothelial growth factor-like protein n=1 Tax=Orf virus TaxID=10258 RepID=Q4U4G1_ORFV|nr:vascular endothelial growth factor-like protein [Orf virus]
MKLLVCILVVVCLHQHFVNADSTKTWFEVFENSGCKPRPMVFRVHDEYPTLTSQRFNPPCVTLMRCGGCCNDESLECVPTEEANVTMQLMGASVSGGNGMQHLSFVEHKKCDCKPPLTTTPPTTTRLPRRRR